MSIYATFKLEYLKIKCTTNHFALRAKFFIRASPQLSIKEKFMKTLTALQLQKKQSQHESVLLVDVREPHEFNYAHIAGSILIPLADIQERWQELERNQEIVVVCHHGVRSLQAALFLVQMGFTNIANLHGGIDAWSVQCDASVPRY
jgi:rhodanese-related sulfurtransferase